MSAEDALIRQAVLDYFDGWFDGDPGRMERALHPELAKRSLEADDGVDHIGAAEMVEATAAGSGKRRDSGERRTDIRIVDAHGTMAAVVVDSNVYREYLHLVRTHGGWRIINALWDWA
jgi:alkyl sulfatase BDS1-like metallo-beta-lactamase superfamily hydrolase